MQSYSELIAKALDNLKHIKFYRRNIYQLYMVCLYCTILELSETLIFLTKNKKGVGIPILSRTLLEAYVDLKNLELNPDYCYSMDASNIKEWLRIATEAGTLENDYLRKLADHEDLNDQITEWKKELEQLSQNGHQVLNQLEKFRNVEMQEEYRSIYNFLCCETHNNIRSLQKRHIQFINDEADFKVVAFTEFISNEDDSYLNICQELLEEACKAIHSTFKTGRWND